MRLRGERRRGAPSPLQTGVSDPRGESFNYFDYLHQIARGAELSTFDGIQIQHDPHGDESWIIAGYVARATRTLTILTEFEASWGSAVYAAKNAVTVQRYTGGRFAWHLKEGPSAAERRRNADPVADSEVLQRIEEFVTVARGVIGTAPYSFKGKYFEVRDGGFRGTLSNHPAPPVYLSGETSETFELSARIADVHVLRPAETERLKGQIADLREGEGRHASERKGGALGYGVRVDLIARETDAEALADAERYAQQINYQNGNATDSPIWAGLTTATTGAAATLVGSYESIASRLTEWESLGVTQFILGAVPHLEEVYRIGTHVLPLVRRASGQVAAA